MTISTIDPRADKSSIAQLLLAIAIPLAMLAVAYTLGTIGDQLLYIGPFDRAAFGWIVVLPISWLAPGVAGLSWSRLPRRRQLVAAWIVGGSVAIVSGVLLATSIDFYACQAVASWTDVLPASLAVGVIVGLSPALGALAAATVSSRMTGLRRMLAAVGTGGLIGFVGLFVAIGTYAFFFPTISCAYVP